MMCGRCGGLMVIEPLCDATGSAFSNTMQGSRCLNCGNIEDVAICTNRLEAGSMRGAARHNIGAEVRQDRMKIGRTCA